MAIINEYSLLFALAGGGLLLAVIVWKWRRPVLSLPLRITLLAGYAALAVVVVLAVRYPATTVSSVAEIDAALADGHPTFIMLYSNY